MTSPNGTVVTANTGGAITDSKGNVWTISASGLVVENGVADTFTANVTELAFKNGVLWQEEHLLPMVRQGRQRPRFLPWMVAGNLRRANTSHSSVGRRREQFRWKPKRLE